MNHVKKSNHPVVKASAPGKLMLAGSYAVVHGHPTVVTAVDQRLTVTVQQNHDQSLYLDAPDLGLSNYQKPLAELGQGELHKAVRFIEILYKHFLEQYPDLGGLNITTKSQFAVTFGFGSSSAVTVAMAKALSHLHQMNLTNHQLFEICYKVILEVQGVGSGFDLAAAIWGGTIKYVKPAKVVDSIPVSDLPIVVGYSGQKADTPTLVRQINANFDLDPVGIDQIFTEVGRISQKLTTALTMQDWEMAGQLMTQHQEQMESLGVSTPKLDEMCAVALKAGAYGATLSGAGGGDCMLALVAEEFRAGVESALQSAGGEVMKVKLNASGVKIENE